MQDRWLLPESHEWTEDRVTRRDTSQQRAIKGAIVGAGRPLSIQEINEIALEESPGLGIRTVYRVVRRLLEDHEITSVATPGQSDRYEPADVAASHHHHFHCHGCDRMFDVHGCPGHLQRMVPEGFKLVGHEITLNGLCDRCA